MPEPRERFSEFELFVEAVLASPFTWFGVVAVLALAAFAWMGGGSLPRFERPVGAFDEFDETLAVPGWNPAVDSADPGDPDDPATALLLCDERRAGGGPMLGLISSDDARALGESSCEYVSALWERCGANAGSRDAGAVDAYVILPRTCENFRRATTQLGRVAPERSAVR